MRTAKPVAGINRSRNHTNRKELDRREQIEAELASTTRRLICPNNLTPEAKKEWVRIKAIDDSRQEPIIYDSDTAMLTVLCENWSRWISAKEQWVLQPTVLINDKGGNPKPNPYFKVMDTLESGLIKLYAGFGLTPRGRADFGKLNAKDAKPEEFDDFFD